MGASIVQVRNVMRVGLVAFAMTAIVTSFEVIAEPTASKYDGMRDPFSRPERPGKAAPNLPTRLGKSGDWESGTHHKSTNTKPVQTAPPPDPLIQEFQRWLDVYKFVNDVWRPSLVYVAGETKSYAIEKVTIGFRDIAHAYLAGPGWAKTSLELISEKAIGNFFLLYSILEPSELNPSSELDINSNIGPDSQALREYLNRLHEQRVKEQEAEKTIPWDELPNDFRGPASEGPPIDVSTEEQRRRAIFANQSLTKNEARAVLAKAAGDIYGGAVRRFTEDWLWLYDEDRINRKGLSQEAINLFYAGDKLFHKFKRPASKKKIPNACLIQPPNWSGTPSVWACTLSYTDNPTKDCYCPTSPGYGVVGGTPKRFVRGMACVIHHVGHCPMIHSEPEGTLCGCTDYPGYLGQVSR